MSATIMVVIEPGSIAYVEMAHEFRKIASYGLKKEMEVIRHHYICVEKYLIRLQGDCEELKEFASVVIIYENLPSLITPTCYVIEGTRELNSQCS